MGKSKRLVTLKTPCKCGYLGAIWVGKNLYCSNKDCQCLIREKGKNRISGSLPIVVPTGNEGSSWKPQQKVQQVRPLPGCGNGRICGDCYKCS
tara:strand:- start:1102 stop:1380 length:279 start_codon:yes stop_codon:yes gene_type:complete